MAETAEPQVNLRDFTTGDGDPRRRKDPFPDNGAYRRFGVQFSRPLTGEEHAAFQQRGLTFSTYIPEMTYVERIDRETLEWLWQQAPLVSGVFPFEAKYKLSPALSQPDDRAVEPHQASDLRLRVVLFPEAELEAVLAELEALGAKDILVGDSRAAGGMARIEFTLHASRASVEERLRSIVRRDDVSWIEPVLESVSNAGTPGPHLWAGPGGAAPLQAAALRGDKELIAVYETGILDYGHCWFRDDHVPPEPPGNTHRKVQAYLDTSLLGQSPHAGFVAGIAIGKDPAAPAAQGIACDARLVYCNREDFKGTGTKPTFFEYLANAAAVGACVHNTSWHTPLSQFSPNWTLLDTFETDDFLWQHEECLVIGASGNHNDVLGPPGSAWNALCVSGAYVNDATKKSCFATGGTRPNWDPRRKPDLLAPACEIESAVAPSDCDVLPDEQISGDPKVRPACAAGDVFCATSFGTPVVAGAAAIVRQYFKEGRYPTGVKNGGPSRDVSGALLKAVLLNSTEKTESSDGYPDKANREGWGLLQLDRVLFLGTRPHKLWMQDISRNTGLENGLDDEWEIEVLTDVVPFKVTLVWMVPAVSFHNVGSPVVNDLDLIVTDPDDEVYPGNHFDLDESKKGAYPADRDPLNTVEMVLIRKPIPGKWKIKVRAHFLPQMLFPKQGFALAASGDIKIQP